MFKVMVEQAVLVFSRVLGGRWYGRQTPRALRFRGMASWIQERTDTAIETEITGVMTSGMMKVSDSQIESNIGLWIK
jgi:hypothetical protein